VFSPWLRHRPDPFPGDSHMSITTTLAGSVATQANVYFDGKCVSHTVTLADGTRKSVGVILPAVLTFNTGAPEIMETVAGRCSIKLKGETEWKSYGPGESYNVPGDSSFEIKVEGEPYHYICHFG
jgi:uncharacterized protein YaiE (UPF0345 family)